MLIQQKDGVHPVSKPRLERLEIWTSKGRALLSRFGERSLYSSPFCLPRPHLTHASICRVWAGELGAENALTTPS